MQQSLELMLTAGGLKGRPERTIYPRPTGRVIVDIILAPKMLVYIGSRLLLVQRKKIKFKSPVLNSDADPYINADFRSHSEKWLFSQLYKVAGSSVQM